MTLPEFGEMMAMEAQEKPIKIGEAVREVMSRAYEDDRLICGVFECARLLEIGPEDVMVCILPALAAEDISVRIQHTLIEAYCRENNINILKVDSAEKMGSFMAFSEVNNNNNNNNNKDTGVERKGSLGIHDFSCVLVKNPQTLSEEDDFLTAFCESLTLYEHIYPVIELPS